MDMSFLNQSLKRDATRKLARMLRSAYSSELAAALVYRGHWKSLKSPNERLEIRRIELEEWAHRRDLRGMLSAMGMKPSKTREISFRLLGITLGELCAIAGWFLPMYFAGLLEHNNVHEYEAAATVAGDIEFHGFVPKLLSMAVVEGQHEEYFRSLVEEHRAGRVLRRIFGWG
jgi:rubrerythrin